jgi:hypothetical protein
MVLWKLWKKTAGQRLRARYDSLAMVHPSDAIERAIAVVGPTAIALNTSSGRQGIIAAQSGRDHRSSKEEMVTLNVSDGKERRWSDPPKVSGDAA